MERSMAAADVGGAEGHARELSGGKIESYESLGELHIATLPGGRPATGQRGDVQLAERLVTLDLAARELSRVALGAANVGRRHRALHGAHRLPLLRPLLLLLVGRERAAARGTKR